MLCPYCAGYVEGTFDLFWRKQIDSGEEEVPLERHSTGTLYELGMPGKPVKTFLTIKENELGPPEKVKVCCVYVCVCVKVKVCVK